MVADKETSEKGDNWCTISAMTLVRHLGGGKFKVINDKSGGSLIANILDASEIYHC